MSAVRSNARRLAVAAGIVAAGFCATAARADFIVDQQPTADIGLISTLYTLDAPFSTLEIDSFTTTTSYRLGTLTAFTSSDGAGPNISVTGSIYSGGPPGGPSANLVATASGTLDADHNIVVNFHDALLPAGTYYLTAFPERQIPLYGIWYWNTTFSGPQALTWPIGAGLSPAPETSTFTDQPLALAYTLTGTLATSAPEPPIWALLLSGFTFASLLSARRRRRAISSRV